MKKIIISLFGMLTSVILYSQNCDCSDILRYGVYNHFSSIDKVESHGKIQTAVSNSYKKDRSGTGSGGVGFKGLTGNFSQSQATALEKIMTSSSLNEDDLKTVNESGGSFVSNEMMTAYKECLRLCNDFGLQAKTSLPDDSRLKEITFTLRYKKPENVNRRPILSKIDYDTTCYKCAGDLVDLAIQKDTMQAGVLYKMICRRTISETPFKLLGDPSESLIRAKDCLISIQTDMGDYNIRIPALYAVNPERLKGVGEIVSSLLTKEEYLKANGGENFWMLADGSEAPVGSKYRLYIDEFMPNMKGNLPDLRGRFLRGYNNGESVNPDNSSLGELQDDAFQGHYHEFGDNVVIVNDGAPGDNYITISRPRTGVDPLTPRESLRKRNYIKAAKSDGKNGEPRISNETRPRNVTVNYFIKIN